MYNPRLPSAPAPQPDSRFGVDRRFRRSLSLTDGTMLVAGGIIGSGIFLTTGVMAASLPSPALILAVWVAAAGISLLGALAFGELGAMLPSAGGPYVYLREAYGESASFFYGWMMLVAGQSGSIAALAAGFAAYLGVLVPRLGTERVVLSLHLGAWHGAISAGQLAGVACIVLLSAANYHGVRWGVWVQNLSTFAKIGALAALVILGAWLGRGDWRHFAAAAGGGAPRHLGSLLLVALIGALWAYDGWIYLTYVGAELKRPERNLPRALLYGIGLVALIYLSCNVLYFYALPIGRLAGVTRVAFAAVEALLGAHAAGAISALIMLSCFGAMNAGILSGARIYVPMAADGNFFPALAHVHPRRHTPGPSLAVQAFWASVLTLSGRYDQLFTYVIFMMTIAYMASVAGLFVLRRKHPDWPRPYRCLGYPYLPLLYLLITAVFAINMILTRPGETGIGLLLVALGLPFYAVFRRRRAAD